jgi:hypothetical protein
MQGDYILMTKMVINKINGTVEYIMLIKQDATFSTTKKFIQAKHNVHARNRLS